MCIYNSKPFNGKKIAYKVVYKVIENNETHYFGIFTGLPTEEGQAIPRNKEEVNINICGSMFEESLRNKHSAYIDLKYANQIKLCASEWNVGMLNSNDRRLEIAKSKRAIVLKIELSDNVIIGAERETSQNIKENVCAGKHMKIIEEIDQH